MAHNKIGLKLLARFREMESDLEKNIFISPLSVIVSLLSMVHGTRGRSREEILRFLFDGNNDVKDEELMRFTQKFIGLDHELTIANGLFPDLRFEDACIVNNVEFWEKFQRHQIPLRMKCLAFATKLDGAINHINDWVESVTNKMIKNIIRPETLNELTTVVLVSALNFKGEWRSKFKKEFTLVRPFYVSTTLTQMVETMYQNLNFKLVYCEELDCRVLEIPYKCVDSNGMWHLGHVVMSCLIFLPNKMDALHFLEKKLTTGLFLDAVEKLKSSRARDQVHLYLPKFKIEYECNKFSHVLQSLGIRDIFQTDRADFSGFSSEIPRDFHITNAIHKSIFELKEEYTETPAGYAVQYCGGSAGPVEREFKVDHPFMLALYHHVKKTILFIGSVKKIRTM